MYLVVRNEEHNDEKYRFSDQELKNVLGKNEYGPLNRINANTEVFIKRTEKEATPISAHAPQK